MGYTSFYKYIFIFWMASEWRNFLNPSFPYFVVRYLIYSLVSVYMLDVLFVLCIANNYYSETGVQCCLRAKICFCYWGWLVDLLRGTFSIYSLINYGASRNSNFKIDLLLGWKFWRAGLNFLNIRDRLLISGGDTPLPTPIPPEQNYLGRCILPSLMNLCPWCWFVFNIKLSFVM